MFVIQFFDPLDHSALYGIEGPFADRELAERYRDQRDHLLEFRAKILPLTSPKAAQQGASEPSDAATADEDGPGHFDVTWDTSTTGTATVYAESSDPADIQDAIDAMDPQKIDTIIDEPVFVSIERIPA